MLERIADGRTDLVFDYVAQGHAATEKDTNRISLIQRCAYYGDVSAIRFLLANGESLRSLGEDSGLGDAAFHGHWRLCEFLIESGGVVKRPSPGNGGNALHCALCRNPQPPRELVVEVRLAPPPGPK